MRRLTGLMARGTTFVLACALGVVPLAACSSSGETTAPAAEEQSQGEAEVASGEETQPDEAVWVMTSNKSHVEDAGMDPLDYTVTYELDEAGNVVKDSFDGGSSYTTYEHDENGWTVSCTSGDTTDTYENEFDDRGRLVRQTTSASVTTYTYDENDNIVSQTIESMGFTTDEDSEQAETQVSNVFEFDANGYPLRRVMVNSDGSTLTREYAYELDDAGRPTSYTLRQYSTNPDGSIPEGADETVKIDITYDENGNIAKTELVGEDGRSESSEYTYALVEHPSTAARIYAHLKQM